MGGVIKVGLPRAVRGVAEMSRAALMKQPAPPRCPPRALALAMLKTLAGYAILNNIRFVAVRPMFDPARQR